MKTKKFIAGVILGSVIGLAGLTIRTDPTDQRVTESEQSQLYLDEITGWHALGHVYAELGRVRNACGDADNPELCLEGIVYIQNQIENTFREKFPERWRGQYDFPGEQSDNNSSKASNF